MALVAAAIGDPLVESTANAGVFGPGFADDNHLSVIPALVAGSALAVQFAVLRCLGMRTCSPRGLNERLRTAARRLAARSPLADLPYVLALQLAALFAMETAERLATGGSDPGGLAWLGGPVLFSLVAHALIGTACTFAFARLARAAVVAFASLVRVAIELCIAVRGGAGALLLTSRADSPPPRAQSPHVRRTGGRAPPLLLVFA